MNLNQTLEIGPAQVTLIPKDEFILASISNFFSTEDFLRLQSSFSTLPWKRKQETFYQQYECFLSPSDQHPIAVLYGYDFFNSLKNHLKRSFGILLQDKLVVVAHRLISADAIGIHNDYSHPDLGNENYRLILQFSNAGSLHFGGELIFFESKYTKQPLKVFYPQENAAVFFQITPESYHAVNAVSGERFTLVLYLWEMGKKCNDKAHNISSF